jgi:hypothetical protein
MLACEQPWYYYEFDPRSFSSIPWKKSRKKTVWAKFYRCRGVVSSEKRTEVDLFFFLRVELNFMNSTSFRQHCISLNLDHETETYR